MSLSVIAICALVYALFLLLLFAPQRLSRRLRDKLERGA